MSVTKLFKLGKDSALNAAVEAQIQALDQSSVNTMIADADYNIIYMNKSLVKFLSGFEAELKKELPAFDMSNLIGQNIDIFHKKPEYQRGMLDKLTSEFKTSIKVGPNVFGLLARPLRSADGVRVGTMVEWSDTEILDNAGQVAAMNKSQAVIHFNMDGTIISANENFLSVMGYSLDEIKGRHHSMFADKEYADSQEYKDFWAILNTGEFQSGQSKRYGKSQVPGDHVVRCFESIIIMNVCG